MIDRYKETSIGLLPLDWRVCELGEIGEFKNGINKGKEDFGHGFPMVNLNDVFGVSTVKNENLGLVNSTINERKDYFLAKGDVLFIRSSVKPSGVGLTAVIPYDLIDTVYSGFIIRFRDKDILDVNFKKHCFYEIGFRNRLLAKSSVSANTNINQKSLNSLSIGIPPLPEQQKIAEILSTVDDKIEVIDQQIIQTQELKKGLMQHLLTKGIGHTEFKDSVLGMIPMSWEVSKISEIADINKRSLPNTTDDDFEFYYIDLSAVKSGTIEFPTEKVLFSNSPSRARRILRHGDVIMATVRPNLLGIGFADFKTDDFICSTGFALISHKENSDGKYIYQNLYSENVQSQINKLIVGSNYPAINSSDVQNIKIPMPPLSEQQKIAEILSSVDDKLEVLSEKKTHYQELKQGLMQQLLTGKIRVKVQHN